MKKATRKIQTEISRDGLLIFRLVQGAEKLRTISVFGYSIRHNLWVEILGFNTSSTTIIPQQASEAKAQIAAWLKG